MSAGGYETKGLPARVQRYLRRVERALQDIELLEHLGEKLEAADRELLWVKITWQGGANGPVLILVKTLGPDGGAEVGFVGDESPIMALVKLVKEVDSDRIKWRTDQYHNYAGDEG